MGAGGSADCFHSCLSVCRGWGPQRGLKTQAGSNQRQIHYHKSKHGGKGSKAENHIHMTKSAENRRRRKQKSFKKWREMWVYIRDGQLVSRKKVSLNKYMCNLFGDQ